MNFTKRSFVFAEEQYFSIDDILATNERIPCRFEVGVHKLGVYISYIYAYNSIPFIMCN